LLVKDSHTDLVMRLISCNSDSVGSQTVKRQGQEVIMGEHNLETAVKVIVLVTGTTHLVFHGRLLSVTSHPLNF